jgi:transposase-like protein
MERKIKQRGKRLIWSSAFKIHVVKTLYEKNWTYLEAATYFNIKRKQTIGEWVRQFGNELRDQNAIVMVHQSSPTVAMDISTSEQIQQLKKSLNAAILTNTALNALIDLAETTYSISIRKNSGTKQP